MTGPKLPPPQPMGRVGEHVRGEHIERCTAVILGAGGDLMKRKLMPAIYYLAQQKLLPPAFNLVAVGRDKMDTAAYVASMRSALDTSDEIKSVDEHAWQWLAARIRYAF